jgi:formylglycine-generating enzyme required for sulfatase activity
VEAFEIGQREVTVGEFRRFVAVMNYRTDAEQNAGGREGCIIAYRDGSEWKYGYRAGYSWKNPNFQQGDDHPVVCVSGNDAVAYTQWLSRETGQRYRLPSEAEWEYAARAGTTGARYWGDDPDRACRYANVYDQSSERVNGFGWEAHACDDGWVHTAPVGLFQPNAWKLYDLLGNVGEWTCSVYDKDYGGAEQKCSNKNTTGPLAVRGGSWYYGPASVRSAFRGRDDPAGRYNNQGFRLARSL